jgi:integrase
MPHHVARLTPLAVTNAKPRAARYAVADSGCRGLYLNVHPTGRKSWSVRYRFAGKPRNLTLDGGLLPLAEARKAAAAALVELMQGKDPAAAKLNTKAATQARSCDTVADLAAQFIDQHVRRKTRPNSARATESIFRTAVLPAWGTRTVHEIARRDVRELLEKVAVDRPVLANRVKAVLSRFFRWLAERDVIAASPCTGIVSPTVEVPRDRTLSDAELRQLWLAADAVGGSPGTFIKLLLLTGQRRGEIAELRWSEVGDGVLSFPAERMKGRASHVLPLSEQAVRLIEDMPREDDFVLGRAVSWHFHHIKRAIDAHMGDTPKWVLHDLRRSVASGMARLGIQLPVIEKILAHRSGTFRGIVGTYQRHSFLPEMATAVQRWADHVDVLVSGKPAQVVKLRRR